MSKNTNLGKRASICSLKSLAGLDTVEFVVGPERNEFRIPTRLLASCEYFRAELDTARLDLTHGQTYLVIRLEGQCPDMFRLFKYWLFERKGLDKFIDDAESDQSCEELHWDLVNLHLFAANIGEAALQDVAMDAIQDIYLRKNWVIKPELVKYVYTECDPYESYRLRKWIVAMIAWDIGGIEADGAVGTIRNLFGECAGLWEEYNSHLVKVAASRLQVDLKNPQLRLPSNNLRNEERQFGYRQCSFHTHRSSVGQGECPYAYSLSPRTDDYVESDSEPSESWFSSRMASPIESNNTLQPGAF
ncbi:hypothetical protein F5Y19DRAFT_79666 [Xylariaceae sp. FL1651]|nr:hypothetical protein F5Y19DRAFT_79666 [Xylariaceae sp. FL1651]